LLRVALIGDVHANSPALEAVLSHARQQGIEAIWNVGDFVGYGAFPDEAVRRLRQEKELSIVGNYDLKVLKFKRKQDKWRKSKHPLKFYAFQWTYEHLSRESLKYLRALPREIRFKVTGRRVLITHGSPTSNKDPLILTTPRKRLRELAGMAKADLIICGHSHQPFTREVDGARFINTGSVGRPDDGDPRTCYAVLELDAERLQVQYYRLEYDVERAVAAVRERGLPEAFAQMTLQGRPLEAVLGNGRRTTDEGRGTKDEGRKTDGPDFGSLKSDRF
jgi:putative phosphoesterase